jgi:fructokinase
MLPSGQYLGGAPFNVAAHLAQLGQPAAIVSRIGDDELGREALRRAQAAGVDVTYCQRDYSLPTGVARAALDASGSARYRFNDPCAWDAVESLPALLQYATNCHAVVYGTLAQRATMSRASIEQLVAIAAWRVLDINLREPHVDRDLTLHALTLADFVKLNESEADLIARWLGVAPQASHLLSALRALQRDRAAKRPALELCITRGDRGAQYFADGHWHVVSAPAVRVFDTVGAGDSFLAMMIAQKLRGAAPDLALKKAAMLAAFVASQPGAVPKYDAQLFA